MGMALITYLPVRDFDEVSDMLHREHLKRCIQEAYWIGIFIYNKMNPSNKKYNTTITAKPVWKPVYSLWCTPSDIWLPGLLRQYQLALGRRWIELYGKSHESVFKARFLDTKEWQPYTDITWPDEVHEAHRTKLAWGRFGNWYRAAFESKGLSWNSNTSFAYGRPRSA
jgi:hypothetical protein